VSRVPGSGTVNAIFRLGDRLAARFPLVAEHPDAALSTLHREADAAREFATVAAVPSPAVVAIGAPGHGYPGPWTVTTWADGKAATPTTLADSTTFAHDVAALILRLRAAPTNGRTFAGSGRGGDLRWHDEWVNTCFEHSVGLLDVRSLRTAWATFRELPRRSPDLMSHTDLIPANLLVRDDRLVGVLDVGGFQPADPALDLVVAWHVFDERARGELREALRMGIPLSRNDEALEWQRGAAWAFEQALGLVWYYRESNPAMSELGRSTLERIMASNVIAGG